MNVQFSSFWYKTAILLPNTVVFISHHPLSNIMADTLELSWPLIWWRKFFLPWDQSQCIRSQRADQLSEHFPLSSLLRSDVQTNWLFSGARGEGGNQIALYFSSSAESLAHWQMSPCKNIQHWSPESPAAVLAGNPWGTLPPDSHLTTGENKQVCSWGRQVYLKRKIMPEATHADQTPWPRLHDIRQEKKKKRPWLAKSADFWGEQSAYACSLCDKKWDGGRVIKTVRDKRELIQTGRPVWLRG